MKILVDVNKVSKKYKSTLALDNVSFTLKEGQILGLLGHNGAGKSSLIGAILGALSYQGKITVCALDPRKKRAQLMQHLAYISDVNVLPLWMTVAQILRYSQGVHPRFDIAKAKEILVDTNILMSQNIATLSKGMRVQLHLALIIATDTRVLILDEPTLGLDLLYRDTFYKHLITWFQEGSRSLIIASHEVNEIEHLLTDVLILKQGKMALYTEIETLQEQYFILEGGAELHDRVRKMSPLGIQSGFAMTKWLLKSQYLEEAQTLGIITKASLQDIFIAIQKEGL
ncbi:ABC transporter ATP-binding protein [Psychromonas sp. CD1]|uniref:ABC transporter ATP-binding protein n=1 Tax=Psychromonas sp. CD1 TaxID=1979839 RepID=UPI000B9C46E4|nr:ABC transporter ATP-binding protein [Psychromonas sp. CD1]